MLTRVLQAGKYFFPGARYGEAGLDSMGRRYYIGSWLFIRAIALIYLAAFASLSVQITGLVGSQGILPVTEYLQYAQQALGSTAWLHLPTLFWIDASDAALRWACYAGMAFSLLLLAGKLQLLSTVCLFVLYLSVFHAGQLFLNFQWDYLLLEAGFLTILLTRGSSRLVIFLFHWLLFRLRFLSGISKTGDPSWMNLSALDYYFETQPLPHAGAWYFHQLPEWLLQTGTGFTLFVELMVPFFIFLPRPFRLFAALSTILLQLLIIASSNHNWINLLTIALCLFLLDDRFISSGVPAVLRNRLGGIHLVPGRSALYVSVVLAVIIFSTSIAAAVQMLSGRSVPQFFNQVRAYGLGNAYHVFPTMQTERYEFRIEGSHDGIDWQQYRFRYKPDSPLEIPPFIVPHQPRLDWMIWFVPTRAPGMQVWFERFIRGVKANEPAITALLETNPFAERAPEYIRVLTFRYRFTSEDERARSGAYWKADYIGLFPFVPPRRP